MPNILKQLPSGPNLDIIRFLGDDSKALGGLKVACTTYERYISRLEEVAHPVLGLRHLLDSKKPATVFAVLKRLGGSLDLPKCSLKTVLVIKDIMLGENHILKPVQGKTQTQERVRHLLSLPFKLKTGAAADQKEILLECLIQIKKAIRSDAYDDKLIAFMTLNIEQFMELYSLIGEGNSKSQQEMRSIYFELFSYICQYLSFEFENLGTYDDRLDLIFSKLDVIKTYTNDTDPISPLLYSALGSLFTIAKGKLREHEIEDRFDWESFSLNETVQRLSEAQLESIINSLKLYHQTYLLQVKAGASAKYRPIRLVIELIRTVGKGSSPSQQKLRAHISRFLLDVAKEGGENTMRLKEHLGFLGKLKIQAGKLTFGRMEVRRETLGNIQKILVVIAEQFREIPGVKEQLTMQIEGAPDKATKEILTDLLAIIKGSESLGGGGGSKGGGGGGSK